MSLWSSLYVGTSGLQTSQNALNTIAHNLTNVDTEGYTRQQVEQSDKVYITVSKTGSAISYQQTGLGVTYSNVKQIRDYFLDKTYRKENGRNNFYETSADTLVEVEDLLGEMNGEAFQTQLSNLWTSVQELSKDPCSSVTQSTLVQEAAEFLTRAQAVYDGLSSYQDNLNFQLQQKIEKINDIGYSILDLNDRIRAIEVGGIEHPNDLRDQRNNLLDELSKYVDMSYEEDMYGNVYVQIEGEDFVKGSMCYAIGLDMDSTTGFYTPFWPQNADTTSDSDEFSNAKGTLYTVDGVYSREFGTPPNSKTLTKTFKTENAKVFNLDREISSELNTDIGGAKAMLLARGDHRATYADIASGDYNHISSSILMNVQAEFDQMIHNVTTSINEVLADAAGVKEFNFTDANGDKQTIRAIKIDPDGYGYMTDDEGVPYQLFDRIGGEPYRKVTIAGGADPDGNAMLDANGNPMEDGDYWVYNEEEYDKIYTLYTLENTEINHELMQAPAKLGFRLEDGSEDLETMRKLKEVFTKENYTLNPNVLKSVSILDYYDDLVSQVANSSFIYQAIHESQNTTVSAASSARDQITAVSSDEELSNMIKFQSAYNASSRFINVVNDMLAQLLNSLA